MTSTSTMYDLPPGWRLATFHTVDSTNAELKRIVAADGDHAEGLILRADAQSAGRGRHGRTWASPQGNLYASFLLAAPTKSIAPQIGFVAAVAVIDALAQLADMPLRCKWPNDILLSGRKVCGILPELVTGADGREWIVLGIGINLQPVKVVDAAYPVTSLAEHGISASSDTVVRILAQDLAHRLTQWREGGFAPISQAWTMAGPGHGDAIAVRLPGAEASILRGRFGGLDGEGGLIIEADGKSHRVLAGEVLFPQTPVLQAGAA